MTVTATIFVWIGAGVCAASLTKALTWLDTPHGKTTHRAAAH